MDAMISAIINEISLQRLFLTGEITSIYFGGGTPSLLKGTHLSKILGAVYKNFGVDPNAEITLEVNPDDVNEPEVKIWKSLGINRISLGVQSFEDDVLAQLNRSHNSNQALNSISTLQNSGLTNISIDLIYGIPAQSFKQWQNNLGRTTTLEISHISSYALTIEDKTAFGHWKQKGIFKPASEESYEEEYAYLCKSLGDSGYEHYEVSNFAKPNFRSKHNSAYWKQEPYLGIGPGGHSFDGLNRFYNISNNASYIRSLGSDKLPFNLDNLSQNDRFNEYLLTGLRTSDGINIDNVKSLFKIDILKTHKKFIDKCLSEKLMDIIGNRIILSEKGLFISDSIIIEFMKD